MKKICFIGAGSTVFCKNVLGDTLLCESLSDSVIALYDIDGERLDESFLLIEKLNEQLNGGKCCCSKSSSAKSTSCKSASAKKAAPKKTAKK